MDPNDLIIIDYPLLASSPPTPNPPLYTDDYFIKLNQAWEKKVKNRNTFFDKIKETDQKWKKLWKALFGAKSNDCFVMKPDIDIQPQQTPLKV